MVDNLGFDAYPDRTPNAATRKLNIGKVCELIAWHEQQMGLLDSSGYTVPLSLDPTLLDTADGSIVALGERLEE